ncbi:MAG TPA: hypothetical protein VIG77_00095 [Ktedonobacterales bacterium]|jgi:hypothetical protein
MPKQRNHPHLHRRRGISRGGFQYPTYTFFARSGFVPRYPPGWIPRRVPPIELYLYLGLSAAIVALMLAAVALLSLFGGH